MSDSQALSGSMAFLAGVLSFLSPCVAPIVPGYLGFIAGVAVDRAEVCGPQPRDTERIVIASTLFVLGFSAVFIALGAAAGTLGELLDGYRPVITRLSGGVMIGMGLVVLGIVRLPTLYRERRLPLIDRPYGPVGTVLLGMAFGCSWTPCIGPVLASILLYAGSAETAQDGALLLALYSAGLGLPFVATALGLSRGLLGGLKRHLGAINATSGALLIGMGILFLTNSGYLLANLSVAVQRFADVVP